MKTQNQTQSLIDAIDPEILETVVTRREAIAQGASVSAKVAGMNTNIRSMEATTEDTRGRIDMTVEIADMKHLEKVIKSVKAVSGVLDVERVYR